MPDESLNAAITARESLSDALDDVADSLLEVAEAGHEAAAAASDITDEFDSAEDQTEGLTNAMDALSSEAGNVSTPLQRAESSAAGAGEEFEESARQTRGFERALSSLGLQAPQTAASLQALDAAADIEYEQSSAPTRDDADTVDSTTATAHIDTEGIGDALTALESVDTRLGDIDGREATVHVDADTESAERSFQGVFEVLRGVRASEADITAGASVDTDRGGLGAIQQTLSDIGGTSASAQTDVETDDAQRTLSDLQGELSDVAGTTARATAHIDAEGYEDTLADLARIRTAAARADAQDVDIETEADVHATMGALAMPGIGSRLAEIRDSMSSIDLGLGEVSGDVGGSITGVDDETVESFRALGDSLGDVPDLSFDTDIETPDQLVGTLSQATEEAVDTASSLRVLGDAGDDIVASVDSLDELTSILGETDVDSSSFEELSATAQDLLADSLAGAGGVDQLESSVDESGTTALAAAAELETYEGQVGDLAGEAIRSSASMHGLAEEIDDVGDESLSSAVEVGALGAALSGVEGARFTGTIAGITGSLSAMTKVIGPIAPMIASLVTALGGLGTAAVGAGGGLAAIFAGGLLGAGEDLAESSAKIQEELRSAGEGAASMPSDMEEAMAGTEEIMTRFREAAYQAMEPLRSGVFQEFSLGVLEGAVELIGDVSTAISRLSGPLLETADVIGAAFWEQEPAILASIMSITRSLLPVIEDMAVGLIRAIPNALQAMESAGKQVIPLLADFARAAVQIIPPVVRVGTAMLSALLPALTAVMPFLSGLAEGAADVLAPALNVVGEIIAGLGDVFGGVLGPLSNAVGVFFGAAGAASVLAGLGSTLATVLTTALVPALLAIGRAMWASLGPWGIAIGAIVTVIDLLGGWEPILNAARKAWNGLMDAITQYSGDIFGWLEGAINSTVGAINTLIDVANKIPGINLGEVEKIELPDEVDASGMKANTDGGKGQSPTPETQPGSGSGGAGSSQYAADKQAAAGDTHHHYDLSGANVDDEQRLKQEIKRAVEEANRRERRRSSPIN